MENFPTDYPDGNQSSVIGVRLNRLPNHKIKWEDISTTDVGFDLSVLKNSLRFSFDWYVKNTSDALFSSTLPSMAGLGNRDNVSYVYNVGKIRNKGFDIEASYNNRIGKDFHYSIGANLGYVKNNNRILRPVGKATAGIWIAAAK